MDRRRFLVTSLAGALATPLVYGAEQAGKIHKVGYLSGNHPGHVVDAEVFRGLSDLGWVEGRNIIIEARYLAGRLDLFPQAAGELVAQGVDVIVTWTDHGVTAAKKATSKIPVVGISIGDPVRTGLVKSLARPGGNVTGVANLRPALTGKWLELLREIAPAMTRLAVLLNPTIVDKDDYVSEVGIATRSSKAEVKFFNASSPQDLKSAFGEMNKWRPGGLLVVPDAMFWIHRQAIVQLTAANHLPAVYWSREYADDGGLLSYAPNLSDMARRASVFVDKILKGAKPENLPVEQPTKFELVINLKTAKALGLTIPPSLLARADQVIE